ncbi:hypothetical protein FKG94_27020 [Exilibacterium tricleocarpae]|uniref:Uncharacterized protein n=1 Tax=Exilibacterium tricleocarpae TaxID=2591008 RepID=A0A545SNE9_9GAMM|nr:hypothetical protein [Exilibacterium tricleocarpae]TQV66487.1 hypothetical protein FKG94_27020 [Exilibacterium tricleocarpae]
MRYRKWHRFLLCLVLGVVLGASQTQAERWEIVIDKDSLDNYDQLQTHWYYLYPWSSDHNGTARMYGSASDRNHISISISISNGSEPYRLGRG